MLAYILAAVLIYCVRLLICGGADLLVQLILFPGVTKELAHATNMDEPKEK